MQIECPPYQMSYAGNRCARYLIGQEWERYHLFELESVVDAAETIRAYSMANYPEEDDIIMLNVRVATPPPQASGRHAAWGHVILDLRQKTG